MCVSQDAGQRRQNLAYHGRRAIGPQPVLVFRARGRRQRREFGRADQGRDVKIDDATSVRQANNLSNEINTVSRAVKLPRGAAGAAV